MKGKHFISLADFSREECDRVLSRSGELKREFKQGRTHLDLAGKTVAMYFEKASTRTRVSFQVGVHQLGGQPVFLSGKDLQVSRGEPIPDTARVLGRYVDMVVIRANDHADVAEFARWSPVPVINGLTDLLHPCQIMADLFTIREQGIDLDRFTLAFIGDGNNMANSWIEAAGLYRFELRVACPQGYDPDERVLADAKDRGARVVILRDPLEAARQAHVLYTDVWVSMGQEEEKAKRAQAFAGFQINRAAIAAGAKDVRIMHCLPAHRGEEITAEAIEGPGSIVFDQAENRLHVQKAIMSLLAGA